jgi:hypothetical protein
VEFWPTSTANATTKAELASSRLLQFVMHTEEVAVRTPTQVASDMIHLMAVGIWILGSSFPFPPGIDLGEFRLEGTIGN